MFIVDVYCRLIKLINVDIMSQLTSRGLDNTSSAFVSDIYIWVLASTLDPSVSKINEALSVTYKLLFILSKNIVPSRSYRYIRDRAFL